MRRRCGSLIGGVGLDADVDVLQRGMLLMNIVGIVGRHQRNVQFLAQGHQALVDNIELGHVAVTLQFQEVAFAE